MCVNLICVLILYGKLSWNTPQVIIYHTPPNSMSTLIGFYDGGSRGNGRVDSVAGSGSVLMIQDDTDWVELWSDAYLLPIPTTNNVAEYTGLIRLLQRVVALIDDGLSVAALRIRGDSLLVTEQVNKTFVPGHKGWKIKAAHLVPLHAQVMSLLGTLKADRGVNITLEHIPRELNKRADQLSNDGMDLAKKSKMTDRAALV